MAEQRDWVLHHHVQDLQAALRCIGSSETLFRCHNDVCLALARLPHDRLAQILSFTPLFLSIPATLCAVSPQMRVDVEAMHCPCGSAEHACSIAAASPSHAVDGCRVQVYEHLLSCRVRAAEIAKSKSKPKQKNSSSSSNTNATNKKTKNGHKANVAAESTAVSTSLWWARRCELPLCCDISTARADVVESLRSSMHDAHVNNAVQTLSLLLSENTQDSAAETLTTLRTLFPHLRCLALRCATYQAAAEHADLLTSVLRGEYFTNPNPAVDDADNNKVVVVHGVSELLLRGMSLLVDFTQLAPSSHALPLTALHAHHCGLRSLAGVSSSACSLLTKLCLSDCDYLTHLDDVTALDALSELLVRNCDLHTIDPLQRCRELTCVDVSYNKRLESLHPLAGLPKLRTITATHCHLRRLGELHCCPRLRTVVVCGNAHLESLAGLADSPCLACVDASACAITTVEPLRGCLALEDVNVRANPLGDRDDVDETENDGDDDDDRHNNNNSRSSGTNRNEHNGLTSLVAAPLLRRLNISACYLRALPRAMLHGCRRLAELDVSDNFKLDSVAPLCGLPCLTTLIAYGCDLRSLEGLGACPMLRTVALRFNDHLTSLAGLSGAACLERIDARDCDLRDLNGLDGCPRLFDVDVSGNVKLESVAGICAAPQLRRLQLWECDAVQDRSSLPDHLLCDE